MSKSVRLSDDACNLLAANRKHPKESLSSVIMRFVPHLIRTFGSLEKHLDQMDAPLNTDFEALERVRERKCKATPKLSVVNC